jgi:hypothetical protein
MLGYTIHPLLAGICAKLAAVEIVDEQMRRQVLDTDLKLIEKARKHWLAQLDALRKGDIDIGGRARVQVGQRLSLPAWKIDECGYDTSDYRVVSNDSDEG